MSTIKTRDNASIFYKDWGDGQPVVFSHGWPLNGDAWDEQMFFLASHGYRVIAHDRRGHGRSSQTWDGNDMNTYADDLAQLIEQLDLKKAVLVGHSTGGGEVTRYIGRHGTKRVAKAALISAVPPLLLKTPANPNGVPLEAFDGLRADIGRDRSQFYKNFSVPFYGSNREGSKTSQGLHEQFWLQCMQVGIKGALDCIKAFSETDFTDDLKRFDIPTLASGTVQRRPVGIHPRLGRAAQRGTWIMTTVSEVEDGASVAAGAAELEPNEFRVADVPPGTAVLLGDVAVFNVGGRLCASQAQCTHTGGPLHEGKLEGSTVTCPFHGA